ncbi:MAG: sporulation protein YqfD [Eubacteriales bacterium]
MKRKKNKIGADGFLYGFARIKVGEGDLLALLNVLLELGESYKNIKPTSVDLCYSAALRTQRVCRERGIDAEVTLLGGVPLYFKKLLARPGIIVGVVIAIVLTSLANAVLWDVRVEGNVTLTEMQVEELLAAHGVRPGALLRRLDIGTVQADIERESDDIAWISVNVIGTVAYVEVIEEKNPPAEAEREGDGSNLVAEHGGIITGYELTAGDPIVLVGQTVRQGELLVSGLYDSERFGYRAVEARGKVFARTEFDFEVEIPYDYTVREPEKNEICEISLIFFSFRQKFFKKGGFSGSEYDKIYSDIYVYNSKGVTLPVGLSVVTVPTYRETELRRTPQEAADLAYFEINHRILAALPDAELLSKSYESGENSEGTAYRLVCRVDCITDIAKSVPFYITSTED